MATIKALAGDQTVSSSSSSFLSTGTIIALSVFFALLCACIVMGHLLEENRWTNESTIAILLGFVSGVVVLLLSRGASSHILTFNEDLFFRAREQWLPTKPAAPVTRMVKSLGHLGAAEWGTSFSQEEAPEPYKAEESKL